MRLKVSIETPCHTTPATISTTIDAATSLAKSLSF
jgi:hypothetical protein